MDTTPFLRASDGRPLGLISFFEREASADEVTRLSEPVAMLVTATGTPGEALVALGPKIYGYPVARLGSSGPWTDITNTDGLAIDAEAGELVAVEIALRVVHWGTTDLAREAWRPRLVQPVAAISLRG